MRKLPFLLTLTLAILAQLVGARADNANYTLNPGDVLQITVWKEDGLDRETLVLPDGTINFPLAGTIQVSGKKPSEVQDAIKAALRTTLPDASVTVVVKAALGYAVNVIGQVLKPGEIVAGHPISVMQALSMAGGLTPYASQGNIIIERRVDGVKKAIPFPYDDVARGKALDQDIDLLPGDVVIVPSAGLF